MCATGALNRIETAPYRYGDMTVDVMNATAVASTTPQSASTHTTRSNIATPFPDALVLRLS